MKLTKYNPDTEPLAALVEEILQGREVETPVFTESEGEYIRQRLSSIFSNIDKEWYSVTGIKWVKPIPHLVKEEWEIDGLKGEWKIKIDWVNKSRKRVIKFLPNR